MHVCAAQVLVVGGSTDSGSGQNTIAEIWDPAGLNPATGTISLPLPPFYAATMGLNL